MNPSSPVSLSRIFDPAMAQHLSVSGAVAKMSAPNGSSLRPLMLIVETINVCNSECVFCPYTIQTRPKGVMNEGLFARIVGEYIEMGGGAISLTPMVGDMLLDRKLPSRMRELRCHAGRLSSSITTNLYALEYWSDEQVIEMLGTFERFHVSCYGITPEENHAITKKNYHDTFCAQMKRLLRLKRAHNTRAQVALGFRTLYNYMPDQLSDFQQQAFGEVLSVSGATATYSNWGNAMRGTLPGHARWVAEQENHTACVLLAIALQVYHDGRVSACACCDYDASPELTLGSLQEDTLLGLFNSQKNQLIWNAHQNGNLPKICRNCSFHSPLAALHPQHLALTNILQFIGG